MKNLKELILIKSYLDKVSATDVKLYDLEGNSSLFDYVFVATVDVTRQARALVDYIQKEKKESTLSFRNINGEGSNWTLIDLNDILLNILTFEGRQYYNLDQIYNNARLVDLETLSEDNKELNESKVDKNNSVNLNTRIRQRKAINHFNE